VLFIIWYQASSISASACRECQQAQATAFATVIDCHYRERNEVA
jgi:hypothetical protein